MWQHAAAHSSSGAAGSGQVLDDEGQQHLDVQQHAAAVQLLNRSLAVAHLRAELVKPRGVALAVQRKSDAPGQRVKLEPGLQPSMTANQQPSTWQLPQQPTEQKVAAAVPAIAITVSTNLAGQMPQATNSAQQQVLPRRAPPSLIRQGHRLPHPMAAAKWLQGEEGEVGVGMVGPAAKQRLHQAPRIAVDPTLQAQGMAGWKPAGAEGTAGELGPEPGGEQQAEEPVYAVPGAVQHHVEEDAMDEEEWI